MRRLRIILMLGFSFTALLLAIISLIPQIQSYFSKDYRFGSCSLNVVGGVYNIPKDYISIARADENYIFCTAENYLLRKGKSNFERKLPMPFKDAQPSESDWTVEVLSHKFMESPVACILKNQSSKDSIILFIENMENTPHVSAFKNESDTMLLLIANCNFKRSDHCELGFVYAWPKTQ